jgi:2,5-dihydroxypyridine 5,6-dioxygenase
MTRPSDEMLLAVAADRVVRDFLCVSSHDEVLITADAATDRAAVAALANAARVAGAKVGVFTIPQLPYQGSLSDPWIPQSLVAAVTECDVWLDLTFPYMGGSHAHDQAMKTKRVRSLLVADLGAAGLARLFGAVDFDALFALQNALDALIADAVGETCRFTNKKGTDVTFVIGRPATRKLRRTDQPGTYTPPGSAVLYPEPDSVRGEIVVDAAFHEYQTLLREPIRIKVDGRITEISGGGAELRVMDRALRRAGGGEYGRLIHFSHGFHPAARFTGQSFIEDIRVAGNNAIGLGIPWWEPGGGENHPDAVVTMQSMWIGDRLVVRDGEIVGPSEIVRLHEQLQPPIADAARNRSPRS